jgi:hypothetical protein
LQANISPTRDAIFDINILKESFASWLSIYKFSIKNIKYRKRYGVPNGDLLLLQFCG